jgi:hypothetical protein
MRLDFTPPDHRVRAAWFFRGMAAKVYPPDLGFRLEDPDLRTRLDVWLKLIETAEAVEAYERAAGLLVLIPRPEGDPVTFLPPGASTERIPIPRRPDAMEPPP